METVTKIHNWAMQRIRDCGYPIPRDAAATQYLVSMWCWLTFLILLIRKYFSFPSTSSSLLWDIWERKNSALQVQGKKKFRIIFILHINCYDIYKDERITSLSEIVNKAKLWESSPDTSNHFSYFVTSQNSIISCFKWCRKSQRSQAQGPQLQRRRGQHQAGLCWVSV